MDMVIHMEYLFIIMGLLIGIIVIYLGSTPKIIIKYPTLRNIKDTTYVDERGQCYKYYAKSISCDANEYSISQ